MFTEVKRLFAAETEKQSELFDVTLGIDLRHSENNNLIGSGIKYNGVKYNLTFNINRTGLVTPAAPQLPQYKITVFAIYMVKQWFDKIEGTNLFDLGKKEY